MIQCGCFSYSWNSFYFCKVCQDKGKRFQLTVEDNREEVSTDDNGLVYHDNCAVPCRLCVGDPEVIIPLLTNQKQVLRDLLKDLWERIDLVLSNNWRIYHPNIVWHATNMQQLLSLCHLTRYYLDWTCGQGWSRLLVRVLQDAQIMDYIRPNVSQKKRKTRHNFEQIPSDCHATRQEMDHHRWKDV